MNPRAVVVICHGVNSHGGQYTWAAEQLVAGGFSVYALDLRGRGKSDGPRFYVETVADYVSDLSAVIQLARTREPGLAVFLLGHSAGGVVSCTYTLDNQAELAGLICESFAFKVPAPDFALGIIKGLSAIAPRLPVLTLKNRDFPATRRRWQHWTPMSLLTRKFSRPGPWPRWSGPTSVSRGHSARLLCRCS